MRPKNLTFVLEKYFLLFLDFLHVSGEKVTTQQRCKSQIPGAKVKFPAEFRCKSKIPGAKVKFPA